MFFCIKLIVSAFIIALASEVAKRFPFIGAMIISLPMGSILALSWMNVEGQSLQTISQTTQDILILILPSLVFFVALPLFIRKGWDYWPSLLGSCVATSLAYALFVFLRNRFLG